MGPVVAVLMLIASLTSADPLPLGATCNGSVGPGIAPPPRVPSGIAGFHASWYGQSGYMSLCAGERATATVAYFNSGSRGWVRGRLGEVAYLGTWNSEPGQDQPSILGGDGARGSPSTGWPRFNRLALQPATYVGPGQIGWFQFSVQAPSLSGTYRLGIRPLIEGATWMEDFGVFWVVTVLNADGSAPRPTPPSPAGVTYRIGDGVFASDIAEVHEGVARAGAYLAASVGGDRTSPLTVNVAVGNGTERFCCTAAGPSFDIVTSNSAWSSPTAAAADTWTASTERKELAAHEYVHTWQYSVGGRNCMLGPRWLSEGMAESLAYRSLVDAGLIPAANMDVFTKRQLRNAQYVTLRSLETAWPAEANPFAVGYLAVDRMLAANGPVALRNWCTRVGRGEPWQSAFTGAFGQSPDAFYASFEVFRSEYVR
ncbi:MAG: hypothetical protein ACRDF9_15025 [Candidatus Limnocylindria bacterium]